MINKTFPLGYIKGNIDYHLLDNFINSLEVNNK